MYNKNEFIKTSLSAEVPESTERIRGEYIMYGVDNLYPQWLYGLYNGAGIHKGILNQKIDFIYGSGVETKIDLENAFINAEDAEYILEGIIKDFEVLGYSVVLLERRGEEWFIADSESEKIRYSKNQDYIIYSEDWSKGSQHKDSNGYEVIPLVHIATEEDTKAGIVIELPKKQYIEYGRTNLTGDVYSAPSYSGAITSIMAHIEMNYYDYAESANGFVSNTIVQLTDGKPETEEEARHVVRNLENIFQDRSKRGGITFLFQDSKDSTAEINELNRTQNVGKYDATKESIIKEIMIAHSVQNASLFGLEIQGSLGGTSAEEQLVAFEKFNKTYVKKRQNIIARQINTAFMMLNGVDLGLKFKEFKLISRREVEDDTEKDSLVNEEEIIEAFRKFGRPKSEMKNVIFSRSSFESSNKIAVQEFKAYRKAISFLNEDLELMLELLSKKKDMREIIKHYGAKGFAKNIAKLRKLGMLDKWEITEKGRVEIAKEEDFEVLYTYEEIPGIPAVKTESREICRHLMNAGKYYTREEIEEIGRIYGVDNLWRYRGGWYHNPRTNLNTRHCRHEWKQHIILKEK